MTSSASSSVSDGRIDGRRRASIVFPAPGGPTSRARVSARGRYLERTLGALLPRDVGEVHALVDRRRFHRPLGARERARLQRLDERRERLRGERAERSHERRFADVRRRDRPDRAARRCPRDDARPTTRRAPAESRRRDRARRERRVRRRIQRSARRARRAVRSRSAGRSPFRLFADRPARDSPSHVAPGRRNRNSRARPSPVLGSPSPRPTANPRSSSAEGPGRRRPRRTHHTRRFPRRRRSEWRRACGDASRTRRQTCHHLIAKRRTLSHRGAG